MPEVSPTLKWRRGVTASALLASLLVALSLLYAYAVADGEATLRVVVVARLALALPPLVIFGVVFADARAMPKGVAAAMAVAMAGFALLCAFEGVTDLFENPEPDDWLEVALTTVVVVGVFMQAVAGGRSSERLRRQALEAAERDPLTGLLNRRGVVRFYGECERDTPLALVTFDLNDLKAVNDTAGHGAGDAYLKGFARALEAALPRGAVGRWGGDEFVALLPGGVAEAQEVVARLEKAAPVHPTLFKTFAAGIATLRAKEPLERAVATADARMYEAKERQREDVEEGRREGFEAFTEQIETLESPDEIIQAGLSLARQLLGFEIAFYCRRQEEAFVFTHLEGAPKEADKERLSFDPGEGLLGQAVRSGNLAWTEDYPSCQGALPKWVNLGVKSLLLVPVRDQGETIGALGMLTRDSWRAVTPPARRAAKAVALRLGHVLERRRVLEEARASLEGGMLGLGVALEARDLETSGHTRRVVALAEALGKVLGLQDETLSDLRHGAYLHDIGKLAVPDAVLLKPGGFTPDEWEVMKVHSAKGFEIASNIPTLRPGVLEVIRHHHERWDGAGYPDGLAARAIPLCARIFAVCDTYDALTSCRPYKRAWSVDDALRELEAQAGKQFDPGILEAFIGLMERQGTKSVRVYAVASGDDVFSKERATTA